MTIAEGSNRADFRGGPDEDGVRFGTKGIATNGAFGREQKVAPGIRNKKLLVTKQEERRVYEGKSFHEVFEAFSG